MTVRMLIDATHDEETRVAIMDHNKLLEYDYESKFRKPLKGSIFLAKVTRVEPSLQAAFVNFGGNRHGFLPFSEIHPDYFRIPIADREALIAEQEAALREHEEREAAASEKYAEDGMDSESASSDQGSNDMPAGEAVDNPGPAQGGLVEDVLEEEDVIEEVGGAVSALGEDEGADDEARFETSVPQREVPASFENFEGEPNDEQPLGEFAGAEGTEGNTEQGGSEGSSDEGGEDGRHQGRNRGGRHRGGRHRGGRHRGGRNNRMSYNSQRVETFGGEEYEDDNRFRFNLRRKYKIQEVIKRGQIMLVQVSKEERGNKGAAVSSYLSLPGRYCVLMPNSPRGGGVSRKIASYKDRARMRDMLKDLDIPKGMSVIVRTAGVTRTKQEIKRDLDYLMRLWDNIRELTLQSSAPAMVYEEADLIKRAIRDLYTKDIEEIHVAGDEGFKTAKNFMKMMIPSHIKRIYEYDANNNVPLFTKYQAEEQIAETGESRMELPSGGYLIINPTEALVSIDVNSGKATKERHIEETALKTNLEAADEVARQLRLRDLGGLIVIDFIDMEDRRNNAKVERRMRDALSTDRARIQMGRISSFGLMELSRQRLNPSLTESQFEQCDHCNGVGRVRTADATSIMVLRAIEDVGMKGRASQIMAHVSSQVALYILNHKRQNLTAIETRYGITISIRVDDKVGASTYRVEVSRPAFQQGEGADEQEGQEEPRARDHKRGRGPRDDRSVRHHDHADEFEAPPESDLAEDQEQRPERETEGESENFSGQKRRRGRRGGRRRRGRGEFRDQQGEEGQFSGPRDDGQNVPDDDSAGFDADPFEAADDNIGNVEQIDSSGSEGGRSRHRQGGRNNNRGGRQNNRDNRGGGRNNNRRPQQRHQGQQRNNAPHTGNGPQPEYQEHARAQEQFARQQKSFDDGSDGDDIGNRRSESAARPERKNTEPSNDRPRDYEKVNEPPGEKKRGWWNRLTE